MPDISTLSIIKKRLWFRSHHMGSNENDLLFGRFAECYLATFTPQQDQLFEDLLKVNDHDLYQWVTGKTPIPSEYDHEVSRMIIRFIGAERV